MRTIRLLTFLFLCLSGAHDLRADQTEVRLPLKLYPFPELARALSAEGRTVSCPAAFAQRVALVHLEKKPWETARNALQRGLGIRIRQQEDKPGAWVLEPDPVVEARHDRWLMKLAELTVEAAREYTEEYGDLATLPYSGVLSEAIRADSRRRVLEQTDPDLESDEAVTIGSLANQAGHLSYYPNYFGVRTAAGLRAVDVFRAMKTTQRFAAVDVAALRGSTAVRQILAYVTSSIRADFDHADAETREVLKVELERTQRDLGLQWNGASRLDFDHLTGALRGQFLVMHPDRAEEVSGFYVDPVQDRWVDLLPKLGRDATEWLQRDNAEKANVLKEPAAVKNVALTPERPDWSLSQWLEVWAGQAKADVIMELRPGREATTRSDGELQGDEGNQDAPSTLRILMSNTDCGALWSAQRLDGIWLFMSRLSFVDRLRELPTAALVRLDQKLASIGEGDQATNRWLTAVSEFHQAVSPEMSAVCGMLVSYRGLDLSDVATARPAVQALASLGPTRLKRIAAEIAAGKSRNILLSTLPPAVLRSIADSMREMALSPRGYAVPGDALTDTFGQGIKRYALHLRPGESSKSAVMTAFVLANPTAQDTATDLLEVEIPGLATVGD